MFKRLFWLTVGTMLGFGGSFWLQRRLREKIERYYPERVANQLAQGVKAIGGDIRAATQEGRAAKRDREESLRSQLRPPSR